MEHEPVALLASSHALLALARGITRYKVEYEPGNRGDVSAVWFQADQLYIATVEILSLADRFEVFPLAVQTPTAGLGPFVDAIDIRDLEEWPFKSWRLDVLRRMEFIVGPEHLPNNAAEVGDYFRTIPAGIAAPGSEESCLTAMGLLFTSGDGRRFLLVTDGMPGSMRVTDEEEAVQSYLRQCIVTPAEEYASTL